MRARRLAALAFALFPHAAEAAAHAHSSKLAANGHGVLALLQSGVGESVSTSMLAG